MTERGDISGLRPAHKQRSDGSIEMKVDWTDRFLASEWPFAQTTPLPPIDAPLSQARAITGNMGTWSDVDGRATFSPNRKRTEHIIEGAILTGVRGAVAHYAAIDASRRAIPARWRRGLFRMWCAVSGLWVSFCGAIFVIAATKSTDAYWTVARRSDDMVSIFMYGLGIPVGVLVASMIMIRLSIWVVNGFRGGP
jgi:hypothetical protein